MDSERPWTKSPPAAEPERSPDVTPKLSPRSPPPLSSLQKAWRSTVRIALGKRVLREFHVEPPSLVS